MAKTTRAAVKPQSQTLKMNLSKQSDVATQYASKGSPKGSVPEPATAKKPSPAR